MTEQSRDWSIQEIARLSGTTSRTLRHYDDIGLLAPSRVGENGYRYYDQRALTRLQRILLLRELGLGLPAIAGIIDGQSHTRALAAHLEWLRGEKRRLDRQIGSVELTLDALDKGEGLMAKDMLDGFDHTVHEDEVTERWGAEAYAAGDRWYRALAAGQRERFRSEQFGIQADFAVALAAGTAPDDPTVQAITARHHDWIAESWQGTRPSAEQFLGLGELYVSDERFAANYGGSAGAAFVRDAMAVYARSL